MANKVIDLFSGCGGLSLGFEMAGFKTVFACDFWRPACLTLKENFPACEVFEGDIKKVRGEDLKKKFGGIDAVIGGPPCQGFSIAGKRLIDDPRNRLFLEFLRIVRTVAPKYAVVENVPPILTVAQGSFKDEIFEAFGKIGYKVKARVLDSRYYGVPQERKRAIFLAHRRDVPEPAFPEPKVLPYVTCQQALSDLEDLEMKLKQKYKSPPRSDYQKWARSSSEFAYNHVGTELSTLNKRRSAEIRSGGNEKDLPSWLKLPSRRRNPKLKNITTGFRRLLPNKPAHTIIKASGLGSQPLHYKFNRQLTVRELARLHSFPDSFVFLGSTRDQKGQVGNSVPPLLSKALAGRVLEACGED